MSFKRCDISQRLACQKRLEVSSDEAENPDSSCYWPEEKRKKEKKKKENLIISQIWQVKEVMVKV